MIFLIIDSGTGKYIIYLVTNKKMLKKFVLLFFFL